MATPATVVWLFAGGQRNKFLLFVVLACRPDLAQPRLGKTVVAFLVNRYSNCAIKRIRWEAKCRWISFATQRSLVRFYSLPAGAVRRRRRTQPARPRAAKI